MKNSHPFKDELSWTTIASKKKRPTPIAIGAKQPGSCKLSAGRLSKSVGVGYFGHIGIGFLLEAGVGFFIPLRLLKSGPGNGISGSRECISLRALSRVGAKMRLTKFSQE
ncbi:hypothetical protein HELRODRAFT_172860 [Helobdella robusta]|uniref:Uncharacterized protein n=1 Tax=Helobdella robusta TaxID=6412 RepID=T1F611_HELRO|nr:hypothetical protein HELRODRAFT_172860 [Helobdella robusta]ESO04474.1 hypothetical protein HELRODRAFT_172860 [Helobdella robusta]